MNEAAVREAVGAADGCELLSYAFAFPTAELACGLSEGSVAEDAQACLRDAGASEDDAVRAADALRRWTGGNAEELLSQMRKDYSIMYLAPGVHKPIFPYESAFIHVQRGLPGAPALFRSRITLDVEQQMRDAGVVPKDVRTEPCDSVFEEFEFLSYLYARLADALQREEADEAALWEGRARRFVDEHVAPWMPAFMERTCELAADSPYSDFASVATALLGLLGPTAQE